MAQKNTGSLWLWPFIGFLVLIYMYLVEMSPDFRAKMTFGLSLAMLGNISLVIMIILFLIAVVSITNRAMETEGYTEDEEEILVAEVIDDLGFDDVIEAEVIEPDIVAPSDEILPEKKISQPGPAPAREKKVYEYPRVVDEGIHVDTYVKVKDGILLKLRTKVAEEQEV